MQPVLTLVAPPLSADKASVDFMHRDLARSGLTPEDMAAYPISSVRYEGAGSYVIPYRSPTMYRTRHDRTVNKYLQPKGVRDIWWSPSQDPISKKQDVLYIIEGEKKAARFVKKWPYLNTIGIGGAWNALEQSPDGTRHLLPNLQLCIAPNMRVIAIFDGDIQTKPNIQQAATSLAYALKAHNCQLEVFRPPHDNGVDDWLESDTSARITDLVPIRLDELAESRKQLYVTLGCKLNDGKLVLNEFNAELILKHFFGDSVYTDKRMGTIKDGEVIDPVSLEHDCIRYMQGEINYSYKSAIINAGMRMAVTTHRDLVQEKLLSLKWDGTKRLDTYGSKLFETTFPAFADDWFRILMTGMALRILKPGTKVDHACILIGAQGIGKSTFFEDLSRFEGFNFYYAVTDLASNGADSNRTQGQMFARSVIVDLAEGVIFETRKATMDKVKQQLTQTHDEYRIVYSKTTTVEPRGFVFVGTTNRTDQLGDDTGSRRFLNLKTTRITRINYAEKLQILAEVAHYEQEIRNTDWYNLRVTVEQAPEELRLNNEHISNIQELVNTQFQKHDERGDLILSLLESDDIAHFKHYGKDGFISANYIAARAGETGMSAKNLIARRLSALSTSLTFPYRLEVCRPRLPQLEMKEGHIFGYTFGIENAQQMINGYRVTKK